MSTPAATPKVAYHHWSDVPREQVKPDLHRRLLTGERIMLASVELQRGCVVPKHAHVHEQSTVVSRDVCVSRSERMAPSPTSFERATW